MEDNQHCIRQRFPIYFPVLDKFAEGFGYKIRPQHHTPSQTDGQSERTIQTLEDMLHYCILDLGGNQDDHLPLVEFTNNNSYQASVGVAPYEALYRRP